MSILNRDDYFSRVNEIVGSNTDEKSIKFVEDMTDTFNDLENKANSDGADWERKYHELDESWKKKYKQRFFTGKSSLVDDTTKEDTTKTEFSDLFKED